MKKSWMCVAMLAVAAALVLGADRASAGPVPVNDDSLEVWFRADAGVQKEGGAQAVNGDPVATWTDQAAGTDQSGANNAAPITSANRPTYVTNVINGHPVLRFDEDTTNKQFLTTGGISGFDAKMEFTAFVVASPTGSEDDIDVFFSNEHNNHVSLWGAAATPATSQYSFFARGVGPKYKGATGAGVSGFNVLEGAWTADDMVRVFVNGVAGTTASDADLAPDAHLNMYIGISGDLYNPLSGDLAEILIYNRELTADERNQVGFYLEDKYGLDTAYTPPVPEPAGLGLLGLALLGLRKRRN
jgi:hypothetical protein